jgi:hypothetical protein
MKSGGERRKRSWNKKGGVERVFPKVRLSRNKWTEAEHITGQGSGTGKGCRNNDFQVEPEQEQVNQRETYTGLGSGSGIVVTRSNQRELHSK